MKLESLKAQKTFKCDASVPSASKLSHLRYTVHSDSQGTCESEEGAQAHTHPHRASVAACPTQISAQAFAYQSIW